MRILAIIGSPRKKGNTYKVIEQVRTDLMDMDSTVDFEYEFLTDYDLEMCKGCFRCFAEGKDACPLNDELGKVYEKMMQSEGIILAAPTYAMGVPALMKNFIDRLSFTVHRPCFFDQSFLSVSTVGGVMGLKQALNQLAILASGSKLSLKAGVTKPPISMPRIEKKDARKLNKATKAFYKSMKIKKRLKPGFGSFAYFSAFKSFTSFESCKRDCPADYDYYKDKEAYFYPVSRVRTFFGKMVIRFMKLCVGLIVDEQAGMK